MGLVSTDGGELMGLMPRSELMLGEQSEYDPDLDWERDRELEPDRDAELS